MSEVLLNTQRAAGLTQEQVVQLTRNAFNSAWIGVQDKVGYMAALDAYVENEL